jgi:ATP-binding protein involved in chromosome partitioning
VTSGVDPRLSIIPRRLAGVKRVVAVTGGKGGIGKSVVSSVLALVMARDGKRAGLLDLDLTSPTDHVILGLADEFPTEEFGLEPPNVGGVRFMSVQYFARERAAPLRGREITDALIEILAVTCWGELDVLIVDMPPGLGDAALDALRLLPRVEFLVVANGSAVVLETVRRMLRLLVELRAPIVGVVENMARGRSGAVSDLARDFDVAYAGALPDEHALEASFGDPLRLVTTPLGLALGRIARTILDRGPAS